MCMSVCLSVSGWGSSLWIYEHCRYQGYRCYADAQVQMGRESKSLGALTPQGFPFTPCPVIEISPSSRAFQCSESLFSSSCYHVGKERYGQVTEWISKVTKRQVSLAVPQGPVLSNPLTICAKTSKLASSTLLSTESSRIYKISSTGLWKGLHLTMTFDRDTFKSLNLNIALAGVARLSIRPM